jgi:hypothetical protein
LRFAICNLQLILLAGAMTVGCASRTSPLTDPPRTSTATTKPILYHRTGGIAGTDDRVVIWPDGVVLVSGKVLPDAEGRVESDVIDRLRRSFVGWDRLSDSYLADSVADAYLITISYGDKTIEASDLAPNLPEQFRRIFTEIEAIAASVQSTEPRAEP